MHLIRRFLRSTTAKTNWALIVVVLIAACVVFGVIQIPGLTLPTLPFSISGQEEPGDNVAVNKKLQFTWTDAWSGSVANAKTFYLYDANFALKETLTTAATGIVASSQNYPSGTVLYVKFIDGNDKVWYSFTVPKMNPSDAEASTYNDVAFNDFEVGTYTTDRLIMEGLSVGDGEQINATGNATTTPSFTYTLSNTGSDNTGILESYDPIYGENWQVWVTGTITGDNYSLAVVQGTDYLWTSGSTQYFADKVSANELSKWVIGSDTVPGYSGTTSCTFNLDLTAFVSAADTATMQITVYAYADPIYAQAHGNNFGQAKYQIAEQTVTIVGL